MTKILMISINCNLKNTMSTEQNIWTLHPSNLISNWQKKLNYMLRSYQLLASGNILIASMVRTYIFLTQRNRMTFLLQPQSQQITGTRNFMTLATVHHQIVPQQPMHSLRQSGPIQKRLAVDLLKVRVQEVRAGNSTLCVAMLHVAIILASSIDTLIHSSMESRDLNAMNNDISMTYHSALVIRAFC